MTNEQIVLHSESIDRIVRTLETIDELGIGFMYGVPTGDDNDFGTIANTIQAQRGRNPDCKCGGDC